MQSVDALPRGGGLHQHESSASVIVCRHAPHRNALRTELAGSLQCTLYIRATLVPWRSCHLKWPVPGSYLLISAAEAPLALDIPENPRMTPECAYAACIPPVCHAPVLLHIPYVNTRQESVACIQAVAVKFILLCITSRSIHEAPADGRQPAAKAHTESFSLKHHVKLADVILSNKLPGMPYHDQIEYENRDNQ